MTSDQTDAPTPAKTLRQIVYDLIWTRGATATRQCAMCAGMGNHNAGCQSAEVFLMLGAYERADAAASRAPSVESDGLYGLAHLKCSGEDHIFPKYSRVYCQCGVEHRTAQTTGTLRIAEPPALTPSGNSRVDLALIYFASCRHVLHPNADHATKHLDILRAALAAGARAVPSENPPACVQCGGPHLFDTSLPSPTWNKVVRSQPNLPDYLCLSCILKTFVAADRGFTATLWGDDFEGAKIEVFVNGRTSQDVEALSDENNQLRLKVRELESACAVPETQEAVDCEIASASIERVREHLDVVLNVTNVPPLSKSTRTQLFAIDKMLQRLKSYLGFPKAGLGTK